MKKIVVLLYLLSLTIVLFSQEDCCENTGSVIGVSFEFTEVNGIGIEKGVSRRDPSDIIRVNDVCYVWYTKIFSQKNGVKTPVYPSGYYGTVWYAISEDDGMSWTEIGEALGPGSKGAFDSHAVFTPNILAGKDKYYLYYTGVKPTPGNSDGLFENNSTNDYTGIGVAVSDSPDGPFKRIQKVPVIAVSPEKDAFDSYRVDDAALIVRNGQYYLYYKGRSEKHGPTGWKHTEMGVAFGDDPAGPFVKRGEPLLDKSHEVLVWNKNGGIASLASISKSINWAQDGLFFYAVHENLENIPAAPGLYRPHLVDGNREEEIPGWGISHYSKDGEVGLIRFQMLEESKEGKCCLNE